MLKASLTAVMIALAGMAPAIETKPNVLLIAIDDLNDWNGCMGEKEMPNKAIGSDKK